MLGFETSQASIYTTATAAQKAGGSASIVWVGEFFAFGTTNACLGGVTFNSANTSPYVAYELKRNLSANSIYFAHSSGASSFNLDSGVAFPTGPVTIVATVRDFGQQLYIKSNSGIIRVSAGNQSAGFGTSSTSRLEIGDSLNARNPNAGCKLFAIAGRCWTDSEVLSVLNNPFVLLKAKSIWVPVTASGGVTITATPGNASAAGTSATVNQARAVTGATGNAAAAGITAKINQARTVTGAVGNTVASGVTATVNRATAITGTTGDAVAAGVHATITAAGAVVITGAPGNAAAAGVSASINQARSVTGTAGNAVAAGVQATISTAGAGVTITATPGNAFASGPQAIIVRNVAVAAAVGNAVAAGRQATVSNITATDDLYPLEGMSQDYPLQGMTQTYPLAGQTPS